MKIYLHYQNSTHRGPGGVVKGLLKGLEGLQIEVVDKPSDADYIGSLQHPGAVYEHLPVNTLMGPNLFVLPKEAPELCNKFSNFVVPSEWVKDLYSQPIFETQMKDKQIDVWSVGIDTNEWMPGAIQKDLDCFVYYKNRSQQDLALVYKICKHYKLNFEIIEYGSYKEEQLKTLCARSKFAILLTGTESQGIAYMNILSTDTPCFVFNKQKWVYDNDKSISAPASSVPYFDKRCGEISPDVNLALFETFMNNVNYKQYSPREYILENHTLEISTKNYIELLKKAQGTK